MRLFAIIAVLFIGVESLACDVCGAVNSSLGLGTVALGNRHSIGLTYQYRTYDSRHPALFDEPSVQSSERFQRLDLTGNVRLADRWQLRAVVPAVYNEQNRESVRSSRRGFADPMLTAHCFVIDRADSLGKTTIRWSLGAGAKMPFGKFPDPHDEVLLLYPGTGTWDGVFQSSFYFRYKKWAAVQECSAVWRSTNKHGYTPGSTFSATLYGIRRFTNWSLFGGFQYAWNGTDYIDREVISSSPAEGMILSATLGATIQWGDFLLQGNYHLPVVQQLGNGYTVQRESFTAGVTYQF